MQTTIARTLSGLVDGEKNNIMKIVFTLRVVVVVLLSLSQCIDAISQTKKQRADTLVHFATTAAPEWTNLFYRNQGWFGADGIFEVTLHGKESVGAGEKDSVLMYFSDTMTG